MIGGGNATISPVTEELALMLLNAALKATMKGLILSIWGFDMTHKPCPFCQNKLRHLFVGVYTYNCGTQYILGKFKRSPQCDFIVKQRELKKENPRA